MIKIYGEDAVRLALAQKRPLYFKEPDGTERPVLLLEVDQLLEDNPGGLSCEAPPAARHHAGTEALCGTPCDGEAEQLTFDRARVDCRACLALLERPALALVLADLRRRGCATPALCTEAQKCRSAEPDGCPCNVESWER